MAKSGTTLMCATNGTKVSSCAAPGIGWSEEVEYLGILCLHNYVCIVVGALDIAKRTIIANGPFACGDCLKRRYIT